MAVPIVKSQFWEDHEKNISFFFTGKGNVIGRDYADAVIANTRNAHYIRFANVSYDEALQSTEENIVNEELLLRMENYVGSQYLANEVTIKLVGQVVGKRVNKNKFKCIVTPEIDYSDIPEIIITEEVNSDGNNKIALWLHTEGIKRIYTTKLHSHARNSYPLNAEYIDSKYYITLLDNADMVYDVDTSNIRSTVVRDQFCAGVNIYSDIDRRLKKVESIICPDIQFATINTETSWIPDISGNTAFEYQKVPLTSVDYSLTLSNTFLKVQSGTVAGFTVNEAGLYMIQLVSCLNTRSAIEDSSVELSLFKNDDRIPSSDMQFTLKADNGVNNMNPTGIGNGTVVMNLSTEDILRLKLKFLSTPHLGVVNDGCRIHVTKLLQIPQTT